MRSRSTPPTGHWFVTTFGGNAPKHSLTGGMAYVDGDINAIHRLLKIAQGDTGQSRFVANFLLAWWNASRHGGFDLTDLWNVDQAIAEDMIKVFRHAATFRHYPDHYGLGEHFEQLVSYWRLRRRALK